MEQKDSMAVRTVETATGQLHRGQTYHQKKLTPKKVLGMLPDDATPDQQDSAIQANFQPKEIHWSERPDTLHLPGQPKPDNWRDVELPMYYRESFFLKDSLFHPGLTGGRRGVAGDPIPYTIANDSLITGILIGCFILTTLALAKSRNFILRQVKNFFYVSHGGKTSITETAEELRYQVFLGMQTCILFAIIVFFYIRTYVSQTFIISLYELLGIYVGIFVVYFLSKAAVYWFVNSVFFDKNSNAQWMKSYLLMVSMLGIVLLPIVLVLSYFDLALKSALVYALIVIVIYKLLIFYRQHLIFFHQRGGYLQNILYFCALEITLLLALWGVLTSVSVYYEINY